MKRIFTITVLCLFHSIFADGASKFWIGPWNANWNDQANWSDEMNGSGGAAVPGSLDSVVFLNTPNSSFILIHLDCYRCKFPDRNNRWTHRK